MADIAVAELMGTAVRRWHVADGRLLVDTPTGERAVTCDCGCTHLLPTEQPSAHRLVLHCHRCRSTCTVAMGPRPAPAHGP